MKREHGFSIVEALISTAITIIILGWTLGSLNDSLGANEQSAQIIDLEQNLRAGMNLLVSDLISAGWSIPIGGIPIPSGEGAEDVLRPGPPEAFYSFDSETIAAVNPGPMLGPVWNGQATDIINILYADNAEFTCPLNDHPLAAIAGNGSSVTISNLTPLDEMDNPIRVGDLIALSNAKGSTLQYVTDVSGQTITFGTGDPMNLNQPSAPAGSITQIGNGDGTFPTTTATRVYLITYYLDFVEDPETPRLIRRINNDPGRTVALILENLQLSYDLVDGVSNPAAVKEPVSPNSPSQIRKANILLSGRSAVGNRITGEFLRRSLTTQVSLRSLSYIDRYQEQGILAMKIKSESGIALIGTLLILVLLAALLEGFILSINSDQELIGVDRGQTSAFYGALAGLEQLTGNLGTLFGSNYSPSVSQINALTVDPPVISGIQFIGPGGQSGYQIEYEVDGNGRTIAETRTIPSGPYEGLVGLITPYTMIATARTTPGGAEVQMRRSLQTVAVPVFQFGIFSETDLSFHAGADFNFGGRVHTNGNLYLAQRNGSTATLSDRVTALGEVVRKRLINGEPTSTTYYGAVKVSTAPSAYRNLALTEGSVVDGATSGHNEPTWTNLSRGTYNGNILNGRTGARRMDLPLVSAGAEPVDLIRRPAVNEDASNRAVFDQRYYSMASLRILLSDTEADITGLPTVVTETPPMRLAGVAPNGTYYATAGSYADGYRSAYDTPLIDGYIKIEMQDADHTWMDVTSEILNLGMTGRDTTGSCSDQANAIIRVQRIKDSPSNCSNSNGSKYWPNVLYDAREGNFRDNVSTSQTTVYLGGVMHYIELDVANLASWLRSSDAINETGYVVYFSDRRTNRNTANEETGEYGFEDFVNSGNVTTGLPDSSLELAEDVNGNGDLDYYGRFPILPDPPASPNTAAPLDSSARPQTAVSATIARVNTAIFFRRALKLVNGASFDLGSDDDGIPFGLAIASENPVYVQGNYNAPGTFSGTHRACSIIADAVTFLSRNWNDRNSFTSPHNPSGRTAVTTWYRTALIAGKTKPFTRITSVEDFGTDGGVHNFIRFLENWGGQTLNYRGSIVSLFFNRQAVGTYKCCTNVYSPPSRGYNFDVEFLQPRLLPPRTPVFRDINITSFSQVKRPHQPDFDNWTDDSGKIKAGKPASHLKSARALAKTGQIRVQ